MTVTDLRQHYLDYLAALDERRFDDLDAFVADELVHDDVPMARAGYRALLEDDVRRIPDLAFHPELVVVDGTQVAARLRFDCTPVATFRGLEPTGRRITFVEHVLYRFDDDRRIVRVWSLLDVAALQRQLAPPG